MLDRRGSFGLSIEPPDSTTVAALKVRICPLSTFRTTS
jgi:hypothetical protein